MSDKMAFRIKVDPGFVNGSRMNTYVVLAVGFALSNQWERRFYFRIVLCNMEVRIGWWEKDNV